MNEYRMDRNERIPVRMSMIMLTLIVGVILIKTGYAETIPTVNQSIEEFKNLFMRGEVTWEGAHTTPFIFYVLIALLIMVGLTTIAFAVGYALDNQGLLLWAKVELLNALATAALIAAIFVFLDYSTHIINSVLGSATVRCMGMDLDASDTIGVMLCRINEKIIVLNDLYSQIYEANKNWEYIGSQCHSFFGLTVACGDWNPEVAKRIEMAHFLGAKITGLEIGLNMEYVAVKFIAQNMLSIFLPLGLVLRAFPPTRGVGGLTLAIALGLYFIFPMMAVFLDPTFVYVASDVDVFDTDTTQGCYGGFFGSLRITNYVRDIAHVERTDFTYNQAAKTYVDLQYGVQFYHFVAFAITVVVIGIMTPIFGGETGNMMRFIMKVV